MREKKTNRLKSFDYSKDKDYFVTFCVKDRKHYFGTIENDEMNHSLFGKIVAESIEWLKDQYSYVLIHEYVVMPDHVHILIEINRNLMENMGDAEEMSNLSLCTTKRNTLPKIKSLSELIGALKTVSSKNIRLNGLDFEWQRSFYDQIIKSPYHFDSVRKYIIDNPKRWGNNRVK